MHQPDADIREHKNQSCKQRGGNERSGGIISDKRSYDMRRDDADETDRSREGDRGAGGETGAKDELG